MRELHDAYILHTRTYTDSKLIIEFLTRSCGRIKVVAWVPSKKNRAQYQPFQLLNITFRGASELKTLIHCEVTPDRPKCLNLKGFSLFCAMYINELVQRVTPLDQEDDVLFVVYESALEAIATVNESVAREVILRRFELELLSALGYQIEFFKTGSTGKSIEAGRFYHYEVGAGFDELTVGSERKGVAGEYILQIGSDDFSDPNTLKAAKQITRVALKPLLGERPLKSRELFR